MGERGYNHKSSLSRKYALGLKKQKEFLDSYKKQIKILRGKKCGCKV